MMVLDKSVQKTNYKIASKKVFLGSVRNKNNFQVITYTGKLSTKIASYFKKFDINIAFRTDKSLQIILKNNESKTKKGEKSGVYIKRCGLEGCDNVYVGQTRRNFDKKNKDHDDVFRLDHPKN